MKRIKRFVLKNYLKKTSSCLFRLLYNTKQRFCTVRDDIRAPATSIDSIIQCISRSARCWWHRLKIDRKDGLWFSVSHDLQKRKRGEEEEAAGESEETLLVLLGHVCR